ncbi:unnamed protein product [Orchesella dallaii]|uniref:Uncharacterized protein n=1 Tax=Orchesella dallaii TaxID=48710 RepID=A0ABP1RHT4_9HEXA
MENAAGPTNLHALGLDPIAVPTENPSELSAQQANIPKKYQPYLNGTYYDLLRSYNHVLHQNNHLSTQLKFTQDALKVLQAKETNEKAQQSYYEQRNKAKEEEANEKLIFLHQIIHSDFVNLHENMTNQMGNHYIVQRAWEIFQEKLSEFLNKKIELEALIENYKIKVQNLEEEIRGAQITHIVVVEKLQRELKDAKSQSQSYLESYANEKQRLLSKNRHSLHNIVWFERENKNLKERLEALEIKNESLEKKVESLERDKTNESGKKRKKHQVIMKQVAEFEVVGKEKLIRERDESLQENEKLRSSLKSLRTRCELINSERMLNEQVKQYQINVQTFDKELEKSLIQTKHEESTITVDAELGTEFQANDIECTTMEVMEEPITIESLIKNIYNVLDKDNVGGENVPVGETEMAKKKNARKSESQEHQPMSKKQNTSIIDLTTELEVIDFLNVE